MNEKALKFEEKKYDDQRADMKKAEKAAKEEAKEAKKAEKEAKKQEKEDDGSAHGIKGQPWTTINKYNVDVDKALEKKVDSRLTSNENEMLEKISNGTFDWSNYDIKKHTPS